MNTLILFAALAGGQPPATFHSPTPVAAKGDLKAGPPLAHAFDLNNNTGATVTITKVEVGCGCLQAAVGAQVLQPGIGTKLAVEVNTLTQPVGPNRWQATVCYKLEAPGQPAATGELLLQITANLSREVSVSPPQVAFSTTGEASQVITVSDARAKPLTITKAASSAAYLSAEVGAPVAGAPRAQPVTLKLLATAPPGHRDEVVVLYTDDPAYPELRVPVRVLKRAAGGVTATPEAVALRPAAGEEASALVQLRAPGGKPVSVLGADCDLPGVAVKHSEGSGPLATVRITVPEALTKEPGRCTVRVRLSEPAGEVTIPVSWTAPKK
jgi:hypothetical protein